ncbi:MAG: tRNA 4-thiouridine(8) synthase ThiI [Verrucomicrobiota bacterium]|nr:tRNA 4-thiouridine(8) synthase ThiI [Verrucomicrobiota bacterium]
MSTESVSQSTAVRALCLLSGGLDSQLAVCVLREQGIAVQGVVFTSPFFSADKARAAAGRLAAPLHVMEFTDDILALLRHPKHGFGQCLNPCIDCHARMLQRAGALMESLGLQFLATGEVLNERPMSQNRRSLEIVARESGCQDLVLRPLSARLLPPTKPETLGWVDRARLLDLQGRSRKPQMELAARYGLKEFPTPAGGCLLTEPNFSRRLDDLMRHEGLDDRRAIELLRYGRHFRLAEQVKLIVGRNERDNDVLEKLAGPADLVLTVRDHSGPTGLLPVGAGESRLATAAAICARYSDGRRRGEVAVCVRSTGGAREICVSPTAETMQTARLV